MRGGEFVHSVVSVARGQAAMVWEPAKRVKGRRTMAEFEEACGDLGRKAGKEALVKGLECIEGRRRQLRCKECGRRMERFWQVRAYSRLVGEARVKRWYYYCRHCKVSRRRIENAISMAPMRGLFLADEWDAFWKKELKCA